MKFIDFEYDGLFLSDFGFIACVFGASSGSVNASTGSKISFTKVSHNRGRHYTVVNAEYNDCLTASFDICKNPDTHDKTDMKITNDELRDIMRWLNRRSFHKFRLIPDECEDDDITTCYYNASFNVEKIKVAEDLVGLSLTLETDKPFGYGDIVQQTMTFVSSSNVRTVYDPSDEVGEVYPDLVITVNSSGDLTLTNTTLNRSTVIKNCTQGEIITIYGSEQILSSSLPSHDIANDFNYEFFKIANTYDNRINNITCSLPCTIKLTYKPIIKDAP